jgi:acyl-CoA thioester hydrolase
VRVTAAFKHSLRVRYSECDPQGVVFNANYVTYFDIALTELWREAIGPYAEMLAGGADMVVAETRVRYLAPARFDDELDVSVVPTRLGNTALTTRMEVRLGETLVAEGEMRHVFVDTGSGATRSIPDDVRRGLEPYARDSGEPSGRRRLHPGAVGAASARPAQRGAPEPPGSGRATADAGEPPASRP